MKTAPNGLGRKAGVAGMGQSGAAAARMLNHMGYTVKGFDSSADAVPVQFVSELFTGPVTPEDIEDLAMVVLSPGIPTDAPICAAAVAAGVPVLGEIELGWQNFQGDLICVTGSNGKTTTVEWLGHVLKSSEASKSAVVAGNMGYAFCNALLDNPKSNLFALELSSYQLETITELHPVGAAFLNLTPDHLARHKTMERYGDAKARIFMNQTQADTAVLNMDDPMLERFLNNLKSKVMLFSLEREVPCGAWLDHRGYLRLKTDDVTENVLHRDELPVPGLHNIANALAVICLCSAYGLSTGDIAASLVSFKGVPHRIESLGEKAGVIWVNDSKSTNIDSLRVALESFQDQVILLAGGLAKNSDYSVLNDLIRQRVKLMVLFGDSASSLWSQWDGTTEIVQRETLEEAVAEALKHSVAGDTVLLSPGCASFDQYRNFEERGEDFRRIVKGL